MADKRSKLVMDILAKVQGAAEVVRLGKSIDGVGDEMTGAARDAKVLERAIDDVTDEIKQLNHELLRTGDIDIDKKLRVSRSTLSMMQRMRKEIGEVTDPKTFNFGQALATLPAQLRGSLILGVVGAGTTAAPLLGGIISSAVIGGVGAGGILGGVALAARNTSVRNAAEDLADRFAEPLDKLEFAFADPVIEALDVLGDAGTDVLGQLLPDLRALAPVVVDIAEGIAGFGRAAAPGISAALQEAVPLLQALAEELPGLGAAVGNALEIISGGGEEAAESLRTLIFIAEASLSSSALAIRGLTEVFGLFRDATEVPGLLAFTGVAGIFTHAANQMSQAALKPLTDDAGETASAFDVLNADTISATDSLHTAAAAAGSLHAALQLLNGEALSARDAERQFQAAIDGVTQSIEDNGRTLDINTQEGRNNQEALDSIATTAMTVADSIYELTGSQDQATDAIRQGRRALIDAAIEMGVSRQRAEALADEILGIPRQWTTGARFNDDAARRRIRDFRGVLDGIPRTKTVDVINRIFTQRFGASASQATFQTGGTVRGPAGIDRVPILATAGEEVIRAPQAEKHRALLKAINSGSATGAVRPMSMSALRPHGPAGGGGRLSMEVRAVGSSDRLLDELVRRLSYRVRTEAGGDVDVFFGGGG